MNISPSCGSCSAQEESTTHILRDCFYAQKIWSEFSQFAPPKSNLLLRDIPLQDWLKPNFQDISLLFINIPWNTLFSFTCWFLWKHRNKRAILNDNPSHLSVHQILHLGVEYITHNPNLHSHRKHQFIYFKWNPPPPESQFLKLNIDGSYNQSTAREGAGGVIRNNNGERMQGLACRIYHTSSNQAELLALKHGLEIAVSVRILRLEINLDSQMAAISPHGLQNLPHMEGS